MATVHLPEVDCMFWLFGYRMSEVAHVLDEAAKVLKEGRIDDATRLLSDFNEARRPISL